MTQYLVEEACLAALDLHEAMLERESLAQAEQADAVAGSQARRQRAFEGAS